MIDQADKAGPKPSVPYSHLYVDAHGVSHQSQCALTDYELKAVAPADPQWNDKMDAQRSYGCLHRPARRLGGRLA